ncbi:beta-lactamase-like protein [Armillaria fumosa]|nr:beta-lactamase-like protein [Armillaria fumosa]
MAEPTLSKVNKVTITFLVDNNIEWFTKLPPGFTHELPQHLRYHTPEVDKVTGVQVLDFNQFCCGAHGFSALINTESPETGKIHLTLFDTGPDSASLVRNVSAMHVPADQVERVIISHWHSDHSGGLLSFLKRRNLGLASNRTPCVVDVHPDRPFSRGIAPGPKYDKVICALPPDPTFELIEDAGGLVEAHAEAHVVAGSTVYVSGEIPRVTPFEQGILGGMRWEDGKWTEEPHIMDERYAAIDVVGKGLIIFSACSHAGIVNVIMHAVDTFSRPIHMVVGGLHLATPDLVPRIAPTVHFLSEQLKPSPTYILPMHCSGFQTKVSLEAAMGEGCVPAGAGLTVEVMGDKAHDPRLFAPSY